MIESRKDIENSTDKEAYIVVVLGIGINWSGEEKDLKALLSNLDSSKEKIDTVPSILYTNCKKGQEIPSRLVLPPIS